MQLVLTSELARNISAPTVVLSDICLYLGVSRRSQAHWTANKRSSRTARGRRLRVLGNIVLGPSIASQFLRNGDGAQAPDNQEDQRRWTKMTDRCCIIGSCALADLKTTYTYILMCVRYAGV